MLRIRATGFALFAALSIALGPTPALGDYAVGLHLDESLVHDSVDRFYDVRVPASYDGSTAVPLVVDVHGLTSSKTQQRTQISGFDALAEVAGFIVAFPQGLHGDPLDDEAAYPPGSPLESAEGPSWNARGFCCAAAEDNATDDEGFLRAMVAAIIAGGNIDERRIYVTGLSNGGAMTHALACDTTDLFAAAAPVAFPGFFDPSSDCPANRPMPLVIFQGYTDLLVPYGGGHLIGDPNQPIVPGAQSSFETWRDANGCAGTIPDATFVPGSSSLCEQYNQCDGSVKVELCSVTGWAASPFDGHILYYNDDNFDISQYAWDFMSQFTLPNTAAVPALKPATRVGLAGALLLLGMTALMARRRAR